MQIALHALSPEELQYASPGESSNDISVRIVAARDRMHQRQGKQNASLTASEVERYCALGDNSIHLLGQAISKLGLSARSYHRILKVARTIADLAASDAVAGMHVAEAISYRRALNQP